jgi:hypothetical protein
MTPLSVVGMGMVSPLGLSPEHHAVFVRAEVGAAAPGAFLDAEGETIPVAYCPWLGATMPVAERLCALGMPALGAALAPLFRSALASGASASVAPFAINAPPPPALFAVTAAPRDGLVEEDRRAIEEALGAVLGSPCKRLTGEAGFFQGLAEARTLLAAGMATSVAIVAVDSLVSLASIASFRRRALSPWDPRLPRPAEGAAAVVVTTPAEARRRGIEVLATVHSSASARGSGTDDDDAPVDGAAMSALLSGARSSARARIGASFGQHGVGALRNQEWEMAAARNAASFEDTCPMISVEHEIGYLGAAAGAMGFVHGATVIRRDAWPGGSRDVAAFVAWAISADGTRGLCAATAESGEGQ